MKLCKGCGVERPFTDYHKHSSTKDRLQPRCKPCERERAVALYAANREAVLERGKLNYAANREDRLAKHAEWRAANKDRHKELQRDWYQANADKLRERYRDYQSRRRAVGYHWNKANPDRARELTRLRFRRLRRDPAYRFECNVRRMVSFALCGALKGGRTFTLLGYSPSELRRHVERQFVRDMSWENYGSWHLDHVVPLSSFNITSSESADFRAAWALTNLRPLWSEQNVRKGAKRLTLL